MARHLYRLLHDYSRITNCLVQLDAPGDYADMGNNKETCLLAEKAIPYVSHFDELKGLLRRPAETLESCAMAAVSASLELNAGAILVLTTR